MVKLSYRTEELVATYGGILLQTSTETEIY